jgi:hypothetical protein
MSLRRRYLGICPAGHQDSLIGIRTIAVLDRNNGPKEPFEWEDVDRIITSLPLWPVAETRVTPLVAFTDRRKHVQALLESLTTGSPRQVNA